MWNLLIEYNGKKRDFLTIINQSKTLVKQFFTLTPHVTYILAPENYVSSLSSRDIVKKDGSLLV